MNKLIAVTVALMLLMATATMEERIPFTVWLEQQQKARAEQSVVQDVPQVVQDEPLLPPFALITVGSHGDDVVRLQEKLVELGVLNSKVDGIFGVVTQNAVKVVQKVLGWEETGNIQTEDELNTILSIIPGDGVNLAVGSSSEWSDWKIPEYNTNDCCFTLATAYLGEKQLGDYYTCSFEVEFQDVIPTQELEEEQSFRFFTQGRVDGPWKGWGKKNVWNKNLCYITEAPANGIYRFTSTQEIQPEGVDSEIFELGVRCDFWAFGMFRVRNVKVEKGTWPTPWTPAH